MRVNSFFAIAVVRGFWYNEQMGGKCCLYCLEGDGSATAKVKNALEPKTAE